MGARGPAPKPLEQKRLEGNPGHEKLPARSATFAVARAPQRAPAGLGREGKRLWRSVTALPWAADTDVDALLEVCRLADVTEAARLDLLEHGFWYETRGRKFQHPSAAIYQAGLQQLARMMSLFGLTPADRMRLGIAEIKAESKFDDLMARKRQRAAEQQ